MADNDHPIQRKCGTDEVHERLLRTVAGYADARAASENRAARAAYYPGLVGRVGCTKIPVVVHVLHKTAAQNISDSQIDSQITVLNEDCRQRNADASTVPAVFQPLAGDSRVEFELATVDPSGKSTPGIIRTKTAKSSFSAVTDDAKSTATDGADPWPSDKYLNIWVCPKIVNSIGDSLLGYAQFPGGPADTDGVVILHSAFGTVGTAAAPFDLGRTTTHEIGHWLNLRHIWGDDGTGCAGSDFVADTPNQGGPNFGKPAFPRVSCNNGPNGDMFMNYMDYVDDAAMVMFTAGQVARMQDTLDSLRSAIGSPTSCGPTVPPPPPCLPPPPPCLPCKPPPPCLPCKPPPPCLPPPPPCLPCKPPPPCLPPPPPCLPCKPPPPCLPCKPPPPCPCGPCFGGESIFGSATPFRTGYDYEWPEYGDYEGSQWDPGYWYAGADDYEWPEYGDYEGGQWDPGFRYWQGYPTSLGYGGS